MGRDNECDNDFHCCLLVFARVVEIQYKRLNLNQFRRTGAGCLINVSATLDWNSDQGSTDQASAGEKNRIPNLNPADNTIDWRSKFRSRRNCEQRLCVLGGGGGSGGRQPKHVLKGGDLHCFPLMSSCFLPLTLTSHSSTELLQQCTPLLPTFALP